MKGFTTIALAVATAGVGVAAETLDVRLMSYNIRYATTTPTGLEKPWSTRLPFMTSQLNYELAGRPSSLVCMQEALYSQVVDLKDGFGPSWDYVGVGRDDGVQEGEFSPIFYQPSQWRLLSNQTYWLSETPDVVGSVGWDAALPRIANAARLQHRQSGEAVVFLCTHFDHNGQTAREKSAELLVDIAGKWSTGNSTHKSPVFLGGDLNVTPDNKAYKTLAAELHDIADVVPEALHYGHNNTSTGFDEDDSNNGRIDHLFVQDTDGLDFLTYAVLNTRFDDGIYISDHRPVVSDVRLSIGHR